MLPAKKWIIYTLAAYSLSGCVAAVPLLTGAVVAGGSSLAVNSSVDGAVKSAVRAEQMNCRQLQEEYTRLDNDTLGRLNPFAQTAVKKASIIDIARAKGCRLRI